MKLMVYNSYYLSLFVNPEYPVTIVAFQYLKTKFDIPASRKLKLPRPRLQKLLGDSAINKTVLVSAAAGYGKTSAIIDWTKVRQEPFAWISLDETDNDPMRFFGYLREALRRILPNLGETEEYLSSYPTLPIATTLNSLLNALADTRQSLFIVLDDYHIIESPEIHEMMTYFIHHAAVGINVIISTRQDPPLPLDRWRVQGELLEVRQKDLCFSREDVSILLNQMMKLDLSNSDIAALTRKTEGWIAGLQIAALFLEEREDRSGSISGFTGSHSHIMNYLMEEVILRQPESIRSFLQETSILDELSESLCNRVTGRTDSRELLERLSVSNQFISQLDDRQQAFRYHHLFGDVLKSLLNRQHPETVSELHHRASQWYEENKLLDEAIRHAFKGGDQVRAIGLIEIYSTTALEKGERKTFRNWLNLLSDEVIRERPTLSLIHAWTIMNDKTRAADELFHERLDGAETVIKEQGDRLQLGSVSNLIPLAWLKDTITLLRAIFTFERGEPAGLFLPELEKQMQNTAPRLRGVMLFLTAHIQIRAMDLDKALETLDDAVSLARAENYLYLATYATYLKAWIYYQSGKLRQALYTCQSGFDSLVQSGNKSVERLSFGSALRIMEAAVLIEWNRPGEADEILDKALYSLKKTTEVGIIIHGVVCQHEARSLLDVDPETLKASITDLFKMERYHSSLGDLVQVMEMCFSSRVGNPPLDIDNVEVLREKLEIESGYFAHELSYYQNYDWLLSSRLARIRLFLSHCSEAGDVPDEKTGMRIISYLKEQLRGAASWGLTKWSVEILVMQAIYHELTGSLEDAVKQLERALDLAASEEMIRVFLKNGLLLKHSLNEIRNRGKYKDFIDRVFSEMKQVKRGLGLSANDNVDLLSTRELEVLKLIDEGCSNQDISSHLYISLNTVKTHIAHIYDKLEVNRRTKAVSRAKQLGILR